MLFFPFLCPFGYCIVVIRLFLRFFLCLVRASCRRFACCFCSLLFYLARAFRRIVFRSGRGPGLGLSFFQSPGFDTSVFCLSRGKGLGGERGQGNECCAKDHRGKSPEKSRKGRIGFWQGKSPQDGFWGRDRQVAVVPAPSIKPGCPKKPALSFALGKATLPGPKCQYCHVPLAGVSSLARYTEDTEED